MVPPDPIGQGAASPGAITPLSAGKLIHAGEPGVESFASYALRLAKGNGVKPSLLYPNHHENREGSPAGIAHRLGIPMNLRSPGINIASCERGYRLAEVLAFAADAPFIRNLCYHHPRSQLSAWRWLGTSLKWCPTCMQQDSERYMHAAWEVSLATACRKHRTKLMTACNCGRLVQLMQGDFFEDRCQGCGRALSEHAAGDASLHEIAVAEQIELLVAAASAGQIIWETVNPFARLLEIAERSGAMTNPEKSKYFGEVSLLWARAANKKGLTLWRTFIWCVRVGISPVRLLCGQAVAPDEIPRLLVSPRSPISRQKEKTRSQLKAALRQNDVVRGRASVPSVKNFMKELGASHERLCQCCPKIMEKLRRRRIKIRLARREERWRQFRADLEKCIDEEIRESGAVTVGAVTQRLERGAQLFSKKCYEYCRRRIQEAREALEVGRSASTTTMIVPSPTDVC